MRNPNLDAVYSDLYRIVDDFDLEALNKRTAPGFSIDQFTINSKVSCFEQETKKLDWTRYGDHDNLPSFRSGPCPKSSGKVTDPIFDITASNHTAEPAVLSAIEVLVTSCGPVGGSEQERPTARIIPVLARFTLTIADGEDEAWGYNLLPPLQVNPQQPVRFQLRLVPRKCRGECEIENPLTYAQMRFRLVFSGNRTLATDQFTLEF